MSVDIQQSVEIRKQRDGERRRKEEEDKEKYYLIRNGIIERAKRKKSISVKFSCFLSIFCRIFSRFSDLT